MTMSLLTSKWSLGLLSLAVLLAAAAFFGRKSVHTEIHVDAPPAQVWAVLMNTAAYRDWNPVLVLLEGKLREGQTVTYEYRQGDKTYVMDAGVIRVTPEHLLNQSGGPFGILTFDHRYLLEPSEGGTRVTIHEDYRGIGVHFWDPSPVGKAYEKLNAALKARVDSLN